MSVAKLDIAGIVIPALLGFDAFIIVSFTIFIIIMARRKYDERIKENKKKNNKMKNKMKNKNVKKSNNKNKNIAVKKPVKAVSTKKIKVKPA